MSNRQEEERGDQGGGYYQRSLRNAGAEYFASGKLISASSFLPVITIPEFLFIPRFGGHLCFHLCNLLSVRF